MPDQNFDARIRTLLRRPQAELEADRAVAHVRSVLELHSLGRRRRLRWITTAAVVAVVTAAVVVPLVLSGNSSPGRRNPSGLVPASERPWACTASSPSPGGVAPSGTSPSGAEASMSVSLQGVTATYRASLTGSPPRVLGYPGQLTVAAAGRRWVLPSPSAAGLPGAPNPKFLVLGSLCLVQFATAPEPYPAVLLQGYTGFAHCCFDPTLYDYNRATARYDVAEHVTTKSPGIHFDPNQGLGVVGDKGVALVSADDGRFPDALGCFACTPGPIRLYTLERGRLVDVTAPHPAPVEAQATALRATLDRGAPPGYTNGLSAAWEADECALGRGRTGWRQVEAWNAASSAGAAGGFTTAQIAEFLLADGYCSGQIPSPPPGTPPVPPGPFSG